MRRMGLAAAIGFSLLLLVSALGLGFMASGGRIDPNLHAMAAFLAGAFALGMHVHGGSGLDFLAVLLLLATLALGFMVSGGGMSPETHFWAAISAVGMSSGTQIRNLVGQMKLEWRSGRKT